MISASVRCDGALHRILLTDKGRIVLADHSRAEIEAVRAAIALGGKPSRCMEVFQAWIEHRGRHGRGVPRQMAQRGVVGPVYGSVAVLPDAFRPSYWTMVKTSQLRERLARLARREHSTAPSSFDPSARRKNVSLGEYVGLIDWPKKPVPAGASGTIAQAIANRGKAIRRYYFDRARAAGQQRCAEHFWEKAYGTVDVRFVPDPSPRAKIQITPSGYVHLSPTWWRDIAREGQAILGGQFILDVLGEDEQGTLVVAAQRDKRKRWRSRHAIVPRSAPDTLRYLTPKEVMQMSAPERVRAS